VQRLPRGAVAVAFDAGAGEAAPRPASASMTTARIGDEENMAETSGCVERVRKVTEGLAGAPGVSLTSAFMRTQHLRLGISPFAEFSEPRREGVIEHGGQRADVVLTRAGRKSANEQQAPAAAVPPSRGPTLAARARPGRHRTTLPLPLALCRRSRDTVRAPKVSAELRASTHGRGWTSNACLLTRQGRSRQCMTAAPAELTKAYKLLRMPGRSEYSGISYARLTG
jgi:hypothetical protein